MGTSTNAVIDPRASSPPKSKRAQVSKACQRCRRLQKGCSDSRPCQRCIKVGLESSASEAREGSSIRSIELVVPTAASESLPETFHATPFATPRQSGGVLLPATVVGYCFRRFFAELHPTIPILSPEYVEWLVATAESPQGDHAQCVITAVCAVVLIQVEEPERRLFEADGIPHTNSVLGKLLFDEATAVHHHLSSRFNPCLERALATFFLYAGHASLFHHSQAFYFLREAATVWLVLRIEEGDALRRRLADRLFWVILVSERSHGIRYRRPVTLQVIPWGPDLDLDDEQDPTLSGLRALVALFKPLDTAFFALLNQESTVFASRLLMALDAIQVAISTALDAQQVRLLRETQLANLRVTQLWLLVILWQLRLRLGLLVEESGMPDHLTFHYPVEIGQQLAGVLQAMSLESIRIHGVGINEKIFDVACAMADVLSRVPATGDSGLGVENMQYLRRLIHHLPGGTSTYGPLLDKHISNTLPDVVGNLGSVS
ncbi:hypothetical protein NEMBOFW57_000014 [Staphylotrichum longicolle]|uniref:Zn(2)-C6 fungal-type domain-containing protein n=1 Tax=Staphylotrichum longicolle TaxID=669026 RepID=A0AAD4EYV7_9PEZI|nr:hypothetical protein NEMBOFW57_000014 [Staphylotrichum longicolle]